MGSKAADVWRFVVPVIPCGSLKKKYHYCSGNREPAAKSHVDIHTLQEEIAAVGARVNYIDEQIDNIKAALPELDSKIRYASLGMPMSSLSLEEMQTLKRIHFKLLRFWEELSRKQLEKLGFLSDCLQILEERRAGGKNEGEELSKGAEEFKEFEQHVNEKVESELRKNQELEMKLYLDRISTVPDDCKPTLMIQTPPERGPQRVASEQMGSGKKNRSQQKLLSEIEQRINEKLGASSTPTTAGHQQISAPSTASLRQIASVQRCKERASAPSTPVLQPVQMPTQQC